MNASNLRKYEMRSTTELKAGDVVRTHGGRFLLTKLNTDEEKARRVAEGTRALSLSHLGGPDDKARIEAKFNTDLTLRSWATEYVGPMLDGEAPDMPEHWIKDWTIQGNELARWAVEVEG